MGENYDINSMNYSAGSVSISNPETGNQDNFHLKIYGKEVDGNNMLPKR